jgi:hypothetical protein
MKIAVFLRFGFCFARYAHTANTHIVKALKTALWAWFAFGYVLAVQ